MDIKDTQEPAPTNSDNLSDILERLRQRTVRQPTRGERILRLTSTGLTIGHNLLRLRWATPGSWEERQRKMIIANIVMTLVNTIVLSRFSRFISQRPPRLYPLIMQGWGIMCTLLIHRYPARATLIRRVQWVVSPIAVAVSLPPLLQDLRATKAQSAKRRTELQALLAEYHRTHPKSDGVQHRGD